METGRRVGCMRPYTGLARTAHMKPQVETGSLRRAGARGLREFGVSTTLEY
jgi:hypothetical protein